MITALSNDTLWIYYLIYPEFEIANVDLWIRRAVTIRSGYLFINWSEFLNFWTHYNCNSIICKLISYLWTKLKL